MVLAFAVVRAQLSLIAVSLTVQLKTGVAGFFAMSLQKGIANSLQAKLDAATQLLEDINENNDVAAVNLLEAFINAVEAQYSKKISEADADALIAAAQEIIDLLSVE